VNHDPRTAARSSEWEIIGAMCDNSRESGLQASLTPGTYRLLIQVEWNLEQTYDFTVSLLSSQLLAGVGRLYQRDHQSFYSDIVTNYALNTFRSKVYSQGNKKVEYIEGFIDEAKLWFLVFGSREEKLSVTLQMEEVQQGDVVAAYYSASGPRGGRSGSLNRESSNLFGKSRSVVVKPMEREIVFYRGQLPGCDFVLPRFK
jgi:hypothetical protein